MTSERRYMLSELRECERKFAPMACFKPVEQHTLLSDLTTQVPQAGRVIRNQTFRKLNTYGKRRKERES